MQHSYLILTDSGGVREEALSLGKPMLVMRDTTERPEAVEAGTVRVVGTDSLRIVENVELLLENGEIYNRCRKRIIRMRMGRRGREDFTFLRILLKLINVDFIIKNAIRK